MTKYVDASRDVERFTIRSLEWALERAKADLLRDARKGYIGLLWWIVEPLLFLLTLIAAFGTGLRGGGLNTAEYFLVGLVLWKWFSSSVRSASGALNGNAKLLAEVRVNRWAIVLSGILADLARFALIGTLVGAVVALVGDGLNPRALLIPLVLIHLLLFIVGLAFFLASIVPLIPDLRLVVDNALTAGFFLSGIFRDLASRGEIGSLIRDINPVASAISAARYLVLEDVMPPNITAMIAQALGAILIGTVGMIIILRKSSTYASLSN